jgi:hypothetical protein
MIGRVTVEDRAWLAGIGVAIDAAGPAPMVAGEMWARAVEQRDEALTLYHAASRQLELQTEMAARERRTGLWWRGVAVTTWCGIAIAAGVLVGLAVVERMARGW